MTDSRLARQLAKLDRLPPALRPWLRDRVLGRAVPFVGTAGIRFLQLGPDGVELHLANRRAVRNHIGGVHAAAMALLAETASGFALGWHLPDDRLPLIKRLQVDYERRAQGALRARACLQPPQVEALRSEARGEALVQVDVLDESGEQPIRCQMLWAWITRTR